MGFESQGAKLKGAGHPRAHGRADNLGSNPNHWVEMMSQIEVFLFFAFNLALHDIYFRNKCKHARFFLKF